MRRTLNSLARWKRDRLTDRAERVVITGALLIFSGLALVSILGTIRGFNLTADPLDIVWDFAFLSLLCTLSLALRGRTSRALAQGIVRTASITLVLIGAFYLAVLALVPLLWFVPVAVIGTGLLLPKAAKQRLDRASNH